jgi:predicted regulator of Ras-like GTPase activity (Roadblock/LC7/MglB family)
VNPSQSTVLSSVAALPGVVRVILTSPDGLVFEQYTGFSSSSDSSSGLSADVLAAEMATATMALNRALAGLSSQKLHRYSFATEHHEILALNLGRVLMVAAVQSGASLRPVQVEMAKAASLMVTQFGVSLEGAA